MASEGQFVVSPDNLVTSLDRLVCANTDRNRPSLGVDQSAFVSTSQKHRQLDVKSRHGRADLAQSK